MLSIPLINSRDPVGRWDASATDTALRCLLKWWERWEARAPGIPPKIWMLLPLSWYIYIYVYVIICVYIYTYKQNVYTPWFVDMFLFQERFFSGFMLVFAGVRFQSLGSTKDSETYMQGNGVNWCRQPPSLNFFEIQIVGFCFCSRSQGSHRFEFVMFSKIHIYIDTTPTKETQKRNTKIKVTVNLIQMLHVL